VGILLEKKTVSHVLLLMVLGMSVFFLTFGFAYAVEVSGKWTSKTPGEGWVQWDILYRWHYDCEVTFSQNGSEVTADIFLTLVRADDLNPNDAYPLEWANRDLGKTSHTQLTGVVQGDTLVFDMSQLPDCQGSITLTVSGDSMYGSGAYMNAGATIHYVINLKRGGGVLEILDTNTVVVMASLGFVMIFVVIIIVVLRPAHIPSTLRRSPSGRSYEPVETRETKEAPISYPEGGTPIGGAGITVPPLPTSKPLPPKQHYTNAREPPRCPVHPDTPLVPRYRNPKDPGSWYCPKCQGYPWGRS
jgi:Na+-transporting methylmalonyl-CoA/oxaloacetate decarboxylase gamma subunit